MPVELCWQSARGDLGTLWVPRARRMAQDWAGFSEEELRRLKQNKGKVYLRAGVESRV